MSGIIQPLCDCPHQTLLLGIRSQTLLQECRLSCELVVLAEALARNVLPCQGSRFRLLARTDSKSLVEKPSQVISQSRLDPHDTGRGRVNGVALSGMSIFANRELRAM